MPFRGPASGVADLGAGAVATSGTAVAFSFTNTNPPPPGALIVVTLTWKHATLNTAVNSGADNFGHTWFLGQSSSTAAIAGIAFLLAIAKGGNMGTFTPTFNQTLPGYCWSACWFAGDEGSETQGAQTWDAFTSAGSGSSVPSCTASLTPTGPHGYFFQGLGNTVSATAITQSAGLTEISDQGNATAAVRLETAWMELDSVTPVTTGGSGATTPSWQLLGLYYRAGHPSKPGKGKLQVFRCMPADVKARA